MFLQACNTLHRASSSHFTGWMVKSSLTGWSFSWGFVSVSVCVLRLFHRDIHTVQRIRDTREPLSAAWGASHAVGLSAGAAVDEEECGNFSWIQTSPSSWKLHETVRSRLTERLLMLWTLFMFLKAVKCDVWLCNVARNRNKDVLIIYQATVLFYLLIFVVFKLICVCCNKVKTTITRYQMSFRCHRCEKQGGL